MSYLIDTNVISELRKGERADPAVMAWFGALADEEIFLSALTLGEIRRGIESIRRRDPVAAAALDSWLGRISEAHRDRVLTIDRAIAEEWGRMNVPDPLPVVDGLLAATAQVNGLTLATRNAADIARTGVAYLDPFAGPSID
ncbi:MAG TPA: type II toxin-antitoxin system VapC family toxin [Solirubrobacterales bacterium]|nr:type II toxin-antitoxin system VapC family toxin [Solirubrobacterales bacterium]